MKWPIKKLSDVVLINPKRVQLSCNDSALTSFIPMENVDDYGGVVTTILERPYRLVKKGYTYFEEGDVIFAKITPCMQNGKHAVVRGLIDGFGFGSTEFHVIRSMGQVMPEWIHSFLRTKETLDSAEKTFTGTVGQQRVPPSFLKNLDIPVPPLANQRSIVARIKAQLIEVEKARQAAELQLREAALLQTKLVSASFDDIQTCVPIGSVAKVQSGYAFKSDSFRESGIRLLRNTNILPCKVYWDNTVWLSASDAGQFSAYRLLDGDVLISLDRPFISSGIKVARVRNNDLPALLVQRVGRFHLDEEKIDSGYLYAFLQTAMFAAAISGHDQSLGVPHISPAQVESVLMPLPSLTKQRQLCLKFNKITASAEAAYSAIQTQLHDIAILPQKILARAFGG